MTSGPSARVPDRMRNAIVRMLDSTVVDDCTKGIPQGDRLRLSDIGARRWRPLSGDIPLPALLLRRDLVEGNIGLLQAWCDRESAWLAPHGKTTMAPQILADQFAAGAWGISVANAAQLHVALAFGVPRILLANEIAGAYDVGLVARTVREADAEIIVLVDSVEQVTALEEALRSGGERRLDVLVEVGHPGARAGVRDLAGLHEVARAVVASPALRLGGVEAYEGAISGDPIDVRLKRVDGFLDHVADAAREIAPLLEPDLRIVSAGGSIFFDRVFEKLGRRALPDMQLVLRSGMYVVHDSGKMDAHGPLGRGPRRLPGPGFAEALEAWAAVLSRPEAGLAILGIGRRDVPSDPWLPEPRLWSRRGSAPSRLDSGHRLTALHDQHAYLELPTGSDLRVGDLVSLAVPHACGAFEKWQVVLTVDEERVVNGAIRTFF